jgi:hypothetical protein
LIVATNCEAPVAVSASVRVAIGPASTVPRLKLKGGTLTVRRSGCGSVATFTTELSAVAPVADTAATL